MNNNLKFITTVMIIVLVIVLLLIAITYFNSRELSDTKTPYISHNSGNKIPRNSGNKNSNNVQSGDNTIANALDEIPFLDSNTDAIDNIEKIFGSGNESKEIIEKTDAIDNKEDNVSNEENHSSEEDSLSEEISGKEISGDTQSGEIKESIPTVVVPNTKEKEPVITSDTETSNQEKQQILNELDDALQGLLEAVGKVPTVDEEKLDASLRGSEVQP